MTVIFNSIGLIRLSRFLSYTNHKSGKFQSFHVQTAWQYNSVWLGRFVWLDSSTEVTFIPVLHELFMEGDISVQATEMTDWTGQSGPPLKVVPNIPVGPKQSWSVPLISDRNFQNFGLNRKRLTEFSKPPLNTIFSKLNGLSLIPFLSIQILSKIAERQS